MCLWTRLVCYYYWMLCRFCFAIASTDASCAFVLVELFRAAAHHKPVWPVVETCPTGGTYYATERRQWCEEAAQGEEAIQPGQEQQPVLQTMMLDSQNKMVPVNSGVGQAAGNSLLQQQQLNQSAPAQMGRQVHLGENTNVTNQQMAAKPVGPQADSANAATGVDQIKKASGPPPIQAVQYKPKLIPGKLVSALLTYKIWHHSGFVFY